MLQHCSLCERLTGGTQRPLGLTVRRLLDAGLLYGRPVAEVAYKHVCQPCLDEVVKAALLPLERRQAGV